MMIKNLVSILIPIHNAEQYLDKSIKSVVSQTYKKIEIICIENGSKDNSLARLKYYSKIYKNLSVIHLKKASLSNALNKGITKSKGEYIARMDADDISHPKRIEKQLNYLKKNKSISIVGTNINLIDHEGNFIRKINYPLKFKDLKKKLEINSYIAHPSVMMRKEIFKKLKGYRFQFCPAEDYDLWLRAIHHFKIENMKEFLLNYRQHSSKMGSVMELQTILGATYARELYFKRIKLKIDQEQIKFNRLVAMKDLLKIGVNKFHIFAHLVNIVRKNKFKAFGYLKILELIFNR